MIDLRITIGEADKTVTLPPARPLFWNAKIARAMMRLVEHSNPDRDCFLRYNPMVSESGGPMRRPSTRKSPDVKGVRQAIIHGGRLARAIRSEQAKGLAAFDGELDAVNARCFP
jgi:hypothetical protein